MAIGRKKKHKYKSYNQAKRQDQVQSTNDTTTTNTYEFSVGDKQDFRFNLAEKNPHPPGGKTASIINLDIDGNVNDAEKSAPPPPRNYAGQGTH